MIRFDPERAPVIVPAPSHGPGYWSGAPGLLRDGADLYVAYRVRAPHPLRGHELRVGAVRDGRAETLVRIAKTELDAESIERSALVRDGARWRLYVSSVGRDRKWQVALLEAASIDGFDARSRRVVLHPDAAGLSAVKDPWLRHVDGRWLMFVSCGAAATDPRLHATGDALSTGLVRSETGLATSEDGVQFQWAGVVFSPAAAGWDSSTARLTTAVRDGDAWVGCYDGSASLAENYEERCGIARTADLRTWERVSADGPAIGTAHGAGGVRYVDATDAGDVFFEYTRADGAHELRGIVASASTPAADPRRA